jgi:hypothetical protein
MKNCPKCNQTKPLFDFYKDKSKKDGKTAYCKFCSSEKRMKVYCSNPEDEKQKMRERFKANPDKYKEYALKYSYGITLEEYNQMFTAQKGCCKICNTHQTQLKRKLFVDHCHTTGKVRGLLCQPCNTLLGQAKDDLTILQQAIKYLEETK